MASRSRKVRDQIELMQELARIARDNIVRATPIRHFGRLRDSFRYIANRSSVSIFSSYYWARFVNDGRKAIRNKLMIFYLDPAEDPRNALDYPHRRAELRPLTRKELRDDREKIVVTYDVDKAPAQKFLQEGIAQTRKDVPAALREFVAGDVRRLLRRSRNKITVRL